MNISWLGHSCFKISEKLNGQEVVIVTAPFGKSTGLFPPKVKADIVTVNQLNDTYGYTDKVTGNLDDAPFIIDRPGEYETKKASISAMAHSATKNGEKKETILFKYELGNFKVAHFGGLMSSLTEDEIAFLGDIDVLMIPVGDGDSLTGTKAAEVVRQLEPRIVIPMEFKINDLTVKATDEKLFVKEMGDKAETLPKLKLSRKDLPEDMIKVVVLEKS